MSGGRGSVLNKICKGSQSSLDQLEHDNKVCFYSRQIVLLLYHF